MKRTILLIGCLLLIAVATAKHVAAGSENAAAVVRIEDNVCNWISDEALAAGTVHSVLTSNGRWKLTCQGSIVEGPLPSRAQVVRWQPGDPPCWTPFGTTNNWVATFTPSGRSKLTCHGDISP